MERWKIEKFCETASLRQLRETRRELAGLIVAGRLSGAHARIALRCVEEAIALREVFGER